ncbi:MAG: hypothetical protein ACRBFS_24675 [Aureispira sp.]
MKEFLTLITLLLVLANGVAGQTQKTLVKTLALTPTTESLQFHFPATVEVKEWDNPTLRLVTTVDANVGPNVLKALAAAGRYGYTTTTQLTTGVTTVTMPKIEVEIIIGGYPLEDQLQVLVYIPKGMNYKVVGANNPDLVQ